MAWFGSGWAVAFGLGQVGRSHLVWVRLVGRIWFGSGCLSNGYCHEAGLAKSDMRSGLVESDMRSGLG